MYINKTFVSALAFATALCSTSVAFSQQRISERDRAEYKREGVNLGGFVLKPEAKVTVKHDDNIYATDSGAIDDIITTVAPSLALESNWSNHALNFYTNADVNTYSGESAEDNSNFTVGTNGRVDIVRDTYVSGGVDFSRKHEDRGSPDSAANAVAPTEFDEFTANAGFYRGLNKISLSLDTEYKQLDFKDGNSLAGANIDNDDRDREIFTHSARVGYEFIPNYQAFVAGSVNERNYDVTAPTNRDSDGYDISVGTAVNLSGKARGEVYVGYMEQDYDSTTFGKIEAPTFGASLLWNPTQLTSVDVGVDRSIEETAIAGNSGYVNTAYTATVEHELQRNVILNANLGYTINEYESTSTAAREDNIYSAGAGVKYMIHRNVSADLGYSYLDRDSNKPNQDYAKNTIMLGLDVGF